MNLLAIDTTTEICSVAALSGDQWFEHTRSAPRLHNRLVLEMVDNVLGGAGLAVRELDLVAFGAGPGSFTGVRIGAAVSQGIALATRARVTPVPSAEVAAEIQRRTAGRRGEIDIVRKSRADWFYRARYELSDAKARCVDFDHLVAAAQIGEHAVDGDRFAASARIVGLLALARHARGDTVEAAFAQPYYVDGDSPWQPSVGPVRGDR